MHAQLLKLIAESITITDADKVLCEQYFEPVLFPKNRGVYAELCQDFSFAFSASEVIFSVSL